MQSAGPDIRWHQQLDNFQRAAGRLAEAVAIEPTELSQLEAEGLVQRFNFTFELAWKTLSSFMQSEGLLFVTGSPRDTIRTAFAHGVLTDGAVWMDMLVTRRETAHIYDEHRFRAAVELIRQNYAAPLAGLVQALVAQRAKG